MNVEDVAGLGAPAKKLIDVISAGMGKLYEPRAIRAKAEADAYAVKILSEANAQAKVNDAEAQAVAHVRQIEILANGDSDLLRRARLRVLTREVEGQVNVEAIAENALEHFPDTASDKPVTDDWRRKFFLEAENVCDADLQVLWGKVLAGETASPGSYSVRTLEVLKNLSKEEAEIFRLFCGLASDFGHVINQGSEQLSQFGLPFVQLLALKDAGLIHHDDTIRRHFRSLPDGETSSIEQNNGVFLMLTSPLLRHKEIPCYSLTQAGKELKNLIPHNPSEAYLKMMAQWIKQFGISVKRGLLTPMPDQQGAHTLTFEDEL